MTKKLNLPKRIEDSFEDSIRVISESKNLIPSIQKSVNMIVDCFSHGGKIITIGNGGSAADSQHLAAELIGRFKLKRKSLPAISLTTDTSIITALGNDYGFEVIFSRQCESLVQKNDVVIIFSTSGKSKNIIKAVNVSKNKGAKIIAFIGENINPLKKNSDIILNVPSKSTSHIQEVHRILMHIICELVEEKFIE